MTLFESQRTAFQLAKENYDRLQKVICRDIDCGLFSLRLQYNPARIGSTNAKTDPQTLQNRPCFLCRCHMPPEQTGIPYTENYCIFVNPYPIFKQHFTVSANRHTPQLIGSRFGDMLSLATEFPECTVFYNGPECGASAPDHFHFQLAPRLSMPLETDCEKNVLRETIAQKAGCSIFTLNHYLRRVIVLQASDRQQLSRLFSPIRQIIGRTVPAILEPMLNILCWFTEKQWTVCLFPRKTRRPRQFFAEGEKKVLFSPGCVDMAGLIVTPRKEDYDKYSIPLLRDLFQQVSVSDADWQSIISQIKRL